MRYGVPSRPYGYPNSVFVVPTRCVPPPSDQADP